MGTAQSYPNLPGWSEYADALARLADLEGQERAAGEHATALIHGDTEATKRDDGEQATAMREGRKVPPRKHFDAWKADKEATATLVRVLAEAVAQQRAAVTGLLASKRDEGVEAAQTELEAAADGYRQSLDGILEARERWWAARRTLGWLQEGVEKGRRYKSTPAPGLDALASPLFRGGDAPPASVVLQAFANEVDPPAPQPKVARWVTSVERDVRGVDGVTSSSNIDSETWRSVAVDADGVPIADRSA